MQVTRRIFLFIAGAILFLLFVHCPIQTFVLRNTAHFLSEKHGDVFTSDNDPELVAEAIPFMLKTYELLLETTPDNAELLYTTGKSFCMYAFAFVLYPTDTFPVIRIDEKNQQLRRAKKLFIRSRTYLLRALELRHPGFTALLDAHAVDSALKRTTLEDTSLLYWTAAAWMGAFISDKSDMAFALSVDKPVACMLHVLKMNNAFEHGLAHNFFISYYGSMPESMGGNEALARMHFGRSVELSKGGNAAPYMLLATSVCVSKQDRDEFKELMYKVIAIDTDRDKKFRVMNILYQRRARWLLDHIDHFFVTIEDELYEEEFEPEGEL